MVEGTEGSHSHKEGPIKMSKHNIVCAGIDTGKSKLDVAIAGAAERWCFANNPHGRAGLLAWLRAHHVERIGIEASGGYERAVVAEMRGAGFRRDHVSARAGALLCAVSPAAGQERQDRRRLDRGLHRRDRDHPRAAGFAPGGARRPPDLDRPDRRRHCQAQEPPRVARDERYRQFWNDQIDDLKNKEKSELKKLVAAIRSHDDLARRLELIESVDGIGVPTAIAILVRMPEIGRVSRQEVAALAGLAPYDDDSGARSGAKHIAGGRGRLRKTLYNASLPAAYHWNPQLIAFKDRLLAAGKLHKVMRVACARKLLIFVNTVVARGTLWVSSPIPA